jgi:hypothetical protein
MPLSTSRTAARALAAAVLLGATSCGPPRNYTEVAGTVTLDGAPLSGVRVWFYPEAEGREQPPYAIGTTDASGVYKLTAESGKPGALVGKNRVVVNWPLPERPGPDQPPPPPQGPPIPIPYTQAADTPLVVEVKPGPPQTIDLPLHH